MVEKVLYNTIKISVPKNLIHYSKDGNVTIKPSLKADGSVSKIDNVPSIILETNRDNKITIVSYGKKTTSDDIYLKEYEEMDETMAHLIKYRKEYMEKPKEDKDAQHRIALLTKKIDTLTKKMENMGSKSTSVSKAKLEKDFKGVKLLDLKIRDNSKKASKTLKSGLDLINEIDKVIKPAVAEKSKIPHEELDFLESNKKKVNSNAKKTAEIAKSGLDIINEMEKKIKPAVAKKSSKPVSLQQQYKRMESDYLLKLQINEMDVLKIDKEIGELKKYKSKDALKKISELKKKQKSLFAEIKQSSAELMLFKESLETKAKPTVAEKSKIPHEELDFLESNKKKVNSNAKKTAEIAKSGLDIINEMEKKIKPAVAKKSSKPVSLQRQYDDLSDQIGNLIQFRRHWVGKPKTNKEAQNQIKSYDAKIDLLYVAQEKIKKKLNEELDFLELNKKNKFCKCE